MLVGFSAEGTRTMKVNAKYSLIDFYFYCCKTFTNHGFFFGRSLEKILSGMKIKIAEDVFT
jgi:hypothetical protein